MKNQNKSMIKQQEQEIHCGKAQENDDILLASDAVEA